MSGKPYQDMEFKCRNFHQPNWDRVKDLMLRFGLRTHSKQNEILFALEECKKQSKTIMDRASESQRMRDMVNQEAVVKEKKSFFDMFSRLTPA